jgi:hypothetical protein
MEALLFLLLIVAPAVVALTAFAWAGYVFTRPGPLPRGRLRFGVGLLVTGLCICVGYGVVVARLMRVSQGSGSEQRASAR